MDAFFAKWLHRLGRWVRRSHTPGSQGPNRSAAAGTSSPGEAAAAQPSRFERGNFDSPPGRRAYRLFVPQGMGIAGRPLVVMLHGCKQDPEDFALGTRMNEAAQSQGLLVLYPQQPLRSNLARCWNWFMPDDQQRGAGEPALLAAMTRHVVEAHGLDASRVYVAGLSAGGSMAAILARTYPDVYAAAGVHSGLRPGAAHDTLSAFAAMKEGAGPQAPVVPGANVPLIVFHGDEDTTVHPRNGDQVLAALAPSEGLAHAPLIQEGMQAGLRYTRSIHRNGAGLALAEHWRVHGAGHAWSGGSEQGSHADPRGPDATREMLRFFLEHRRRV